MYSFKIFAKVGTLYHDTITKIVTTTKSLRYHLLKSTVTIGCLQLHKSLINIDIDLVMDDCTFAIRFLLKQ